LALVFDAYILAAIIILLVYIIHAILFTDHIYYNPKVDYQFNFSSALAFKCNLKNGELILEQPLSEAIDTCVLPVNVKHTFSGLVFDPYIDITSNGITSRQYVERGVDGKRYINLSRFCEILKQPRGVIKLTSSHCTISDGSSEMLGFANPDYRSKRVLIISPHADDAELAAFGFYKNTASVLIATISAGEVDEKPFETLTGRGNKTAAGLLKGKLRAWDSIAIPLWAGRHVETVHLGYFCMTLESMYEKPGTIIPSHTVDENYIAAFRAFNKKNLATDAFAKNSWENLVFDLTELISDYRPDIIITPHPIIDPQPDHLYSTRATLLACEAAQSAPEFLLYANHYKHTDMYPYGPEHTDLPLSPHFEKDIIASKLYSFPLSDADQIDKVCALKMMHDLNRPISIKKYVRRLLQRIIGRSQMPYGDDDYLRKAIRQQVLFWITSKEKLKSFL
jgi:LmbE family N-acetylglucosaminyl deacetylase